MSSSHTQPLQSSPSPTDNSLEPTGKLTFLDGIAVIVGIVVGAGIFRTPSLVAANTGDAYLFLGVWLAGGAASMIGALCYAELTTSYPSKGGDYHFLYLSFGKKLAFLFAWARMTVVQTGSIALLAYITGDYMNQLFDLGQAGPPVYAASVIVLLTLINILGIHYGTNTQKILTLLEIVGILAIMITALFFSQQGQQQTTPLDTSSTGNNTSTSLGLAMVFVLLTYGGWNEAAYISAELKAGKRKMVGILIVGILSITLIYFLVNLAYLKFLGLDAIAASEAVGADVMQLAFGDIGSILISLLVVVSALTSANATIFTGARTNYALGRDFSKLAYLGVWNNKASAPVNALIVQAIISLLLITLSLFTRSGFETIVEYTAPVFWLFFLLVGISLFILRHKQPAMKRPFKVPLYPITPFIFCCISAYLLYSSLVHTGIGAMVGVVVLALGGLALLFIPTEKTNNENNTDNLLVKK